MKRSLVVCFGAFLLAACHHASSTGPTAANASDSASSGGSTGPLRVTSVALGDTVSDVRVECHRDAPDACNALDDDCSGVIDDSCGYGGGVMQVTASWTTGVDIDLYVTDPVGETLSFQRTEGLDGGRVDRMARGRCDPQDHEPFVEDVTWSTRPPAGTYEVVLHYWGECMANAGPTTVVFSLALGHEVVGSFHVELVPNQRAVALHFTIE